jgi:3',5'-cyclic AMP phosphodiesterase CpdA
MVLSDTHLYDDTLGTSGAAWDAYMADDRKLLKDSEETLRAAMARIEAAKPSFVLVTGDLTKDGERQNHELFASYLKQLGALGIKTYVLPGNHDINNPAANRFLPSGTTEPVPTVNPAEFASIYAASGYGQALYRDPASLSYVAEPLPGLWLLVLDSAKYEHNAGKKWSETSGAIREPTYRWIEERLIEARGKGVAVIAAEHHPLMEHFDGMKAKYPEYVVDDNWRLAGLLASYDVRLFFSGHYHANSAVMRRWGMDAPAGLRGKYIVDMETGSLVTWPCSFRTITLSKDGRTTVATSRVEQLPSYEAAGASFSVEGKRIIEGGISGIAASTMKGLGVPQRDIDRLTPAIVSAMMAHYYGDARFEGTEMLPSRGLSLMGDLVVASYHDFVRGLWKEKAPRKVELMEDNDFILLSDGAWSRIVN